MSSTFKQVLMVTLLAGGCYAGEVGYSGTVVAETPDLVEVSPGVRVVADYDEPIFFANGFYWWFGDGMWYRSSYYTGGWVYAPSPPSVVLGIREPFRFRHYRPGNYVVRHRPVPSNRWQRPTRRAGGPRIRDHRR